jgi:hypothetical protein
MKINDTIINKYGKVGKIICIDTHDSGEIIFGIQYNERKNSYDNLDGRCPDNYGRYERGFDIIKVNINSFKKIKDKVLAQLFKTIYLKKCIEKIHINANIEYIKNKIDYDKKRLTDNNYSDDDRHYLNRELDDYCERLKKEEERFNQKIDLRSVKDQYQRILNHDKVESIEYYQNYIIITTKDILFNDEGRGIKDFNIGAFKIKFNENFNFFAVNYKMHLMKIFFHPCIRFGNDVCLGSSVAYEIEKHKENFDFDLLIYTLINFIEEPNYGKPFMKIENLIKFMQPVTMKPNTPLEWFNQSYWNENEKWDEKLYIKFQQEQQPEPQQQGTITLREYEALYVDGVEQASTWDQADDNAIREFYRRIHI